MYRPQFPRIVSCVQQLFGPQKTAILVPGFQFSHPGFHGLPIHDRQEGIGGGGQRSHHRKHSAFDVFPWPF